MSSDTPAQPVLSVRVDAAAESITRVCRFDGDAFSIEQSQSVVVVPTDDVVDTLTREVGQSADATDAALAAIVAFGDDVLVYALAERRDGEWTDLRHALQPVATTWEDVRSGIVLATADLISAAQDTVR